MKRLSLFFTLALVATCMFAQESTTAGRKTTFVSSGFWDNWFVGVGAGANMVVGDNNAGDADLLDRITVAPTIQVGKWFNPYFGSRLKFQGGSLHEFEALNANTDVMLHSKYAAGELDFMWNMSNYFGKYKENRFYSFIPYLGLGWGFSWDHKVHGNQYMAKQGTFTLNGGIINKFRLSKRVDLDIDLSAALIKEDFNGAGINDYDGLVAASASLVFKLGKVGFQEAELKDQSLIDDLNNQINRLRAENAELSKRPVSCPKCPEVKPQAAASNVYVPNVVFFRLGSATIDKGQEISIYNTAEYLKNNPNAKVKVVAYADKKTGTASFNEKLSEKRAKNVANALINKYNIDSNKVSVDWKGDTEQPYSVNSWNRVAIFLAD